MRQTPTQLGRKEHVEMYGANRMAKTNHVRKAWSLQPLLFNYRAFHVLAAWQTVNILKSEHLTYISCIKGFCFLCIRSIS
jgi:hypothetical protein